MKKINLLFFVFFSMYVVASRAQALAGQNVEWMRVASPSGDVSVAFPADGNLVISFDDGYQISHFEPGLTLSFRTKNFDYPKRIFSAERSLSKDTTASYYKMGDFFIRQSAPSDAEAEHIDNDLTLASSKNFYVITAHCPKARRLRCAAFQNSIKVNDTSLFTGKPVPTESRTVRINDLKISDVIVDALNQPDANAPKFQKGSPPDLTDTSKVDYSRELIMLRFPQPKYSPLMTRTAVANSPARTGMIRQSAVKLRITFLANGRIGPIFLVASLDDLHDIAAFEAAKKIKFLPAEVDGKSVDVVRDFVYGFQLF
jgi:hypothetical protein